MNKNRIEELVNDFMSDLIDNMEVDSEGYPHKPYVSGCDMENEEFYKLVDSINILLGNNASILKLFEPKSIEEIEKEINENNYSNFEELEEVDMFTDSDSEPKYQYVTYIYKYTKTGKHISITIQRSGDVDLGIVFNGIVEKKEVVKYEWS